MSNSQHPAAHFNGDRGLQLESPQESQQLSYRQAALPLGPDNDFFFRPLAAAFNRQSAA
jgi:hypothetical protein